MRYPASEKLEIIRIVEQSHLPVRRTLAQIGVPPTTFYRWYDRYVEHGPEGLEDRPSRPSRVWNRIPDAVRDRIVELALSEPDLSPRELAVRFTDTEKYFVSEDIRLGQGTVCAHFRSSRIRALARTMSLRMTAVIATFAGFPASLSVL